MFSSYLKIGERCSHCDLDFRGEDAGDGPAVFIIFAVGFIVIPLVMVTEFAFQPPYWLHLVIWFPLSIGLILMMLPPFKATLFALQFQNDAHEGRLDIKPPSDED